MAEQNGDELSKIDTTMLQGAFAQLAAVVLTDVRACGKSAFCACKIMMRVYALPQRLASGFRVQFLFELTTANRLS